MSTFQLSNTTTGPIPDASLREYIVSDVLGPVYFGVIIFVALYGMSTVQTILYFQRSQEDHIIRKVTIAIIWFINTALVSVIIYLGQCAFVNSTWAIPSIMDTKSWTLATWYMLAGVSDLFVYSIMIHIVWTMAGKKMWLLYLLVAPSVPGFAGIIAYTWISLKNPLAISEKQNAWTWYLPYTSHAFIDIVLCVALTTKLIQMHTGFKNSNLVIRFLVMWSVNSGFLASTLILTSIILYAAEPQSTVCKTVASSLSQVVLNSLLALLNTRDYRKRILDGRNEELKLSMTPLPLPTTSIRTAMLPPISVGTVDTDASTLRRSVQVNGTGTEVMFVQDDIMAKAVQL